MKEFKDNEIITNFPSSNELKIEIPTPVQPQYDYITLPSSQSLSFESRFVCREITSVGPMYYQS